MRTPHLTSPSLLLVLFTACSDTGGSTADMTSADMASADMASADMASADTGAADAMVDPVDVDCVAERCGDFDARYAADGTPRPACDSDAECADETLCIRPDLLHGSDYAYEDSRWSVYAPEPPPGEGHCLPIADLTLPCELPPGCVSEARGCNGASHFLNTRCPVVDCSTRPLACNIEDHACLTEALGQATPGTRVQYWIGNAEDGHGYIWDFFADGQALMTRSYQGDGESFPVQYGPVTVNAPAFEQCPAGDSDNARNDPCDETILGCE